ncbi:hypothetical protein SAMN02982917_7009 [Azospirillum oryzae]|uniref:Uncharacterized protein n=1 Tax=Azospirillum oryzae TaxID=286727 RepID=A0A1X7HP01_9PROT|nr:hypothetical protein SAMN02982917_7009 [Azospirillum oryzae]
MRSVWTYQMSSFEVMIARASNDQDQEVVFSSIPADAVSRIRWRLWHGQTERALALIGDTLTELDALLEAADDRQARKVATLLRALETYVVGQADLIIDYAAPRGRGHVPDRGVGAVGNRPAEAPPPELA